MQYKAQIGKILFTDALSLSLLIAVAASAGMLAAAVLLIPAGLILVLAAARLVERVGRIRTTVERGAQAEGILASKHFSRGRWELWYVFRGADDQMHRVRNLTARALPSAEGDTVRVSYDPADPKGAFLTDLYAAEGQHHGAG